MVRKPIITSEDLIAKARAAGEIDYETSLLYRAYAIFGDPRLPNKYVSDVIHLDAGTSLFSEVTANAARLSPATLKTLAPFMARPNDPSSILNTSRSGSADISLVPTGCTFVGAAGWTGPCPPSLGRASSGYVLINGSLQGDILTFTIAHELFHVSQFSYSNSEVWLAESTATWGGFRVLQELGRNTEVVHSYLPEFFSDLDFIPLDLPGGVLHEYGAYLYFLFAQMERGDAIVSDVWAYASTMDEAKAVDAAFPFKDNFREFALRNWNFDPVPKRYQAVDNTFPDLGPPITHDPIVLSQDHTENLDNTVNRLTARYYRLVVPNNIAKVQVRLGELAQNPDAGVDAIVTIENKPAEVRHWTGESEETFCLDDPDERLRKLVLIVSNANLENDLQGKIEVEAFHKPCSELGATLNVSATYTAEVNDPKTQMEDHITLTYRGRARYKLAPYKAGPRNFDPTGLSTSPERGVKTERTGGFTVNVEGRGHMGDKMTWTHSAKCTAVSPDQFPSIGLQLRPGKYGVGYEFPDDAITGETQVAGITEPRGGPYAKYLLTMLHGSSIRQVSDSLSGTFPPFSKHFTRSNSVANSMSQANGTASFNISYSLTVGRE